MIERKVRIHLNWMQFSGASMHDCFSLVKILFSSCSFSMHYQLLNCLKFVFPYCTTFQKPFFLPTNIVSKVQGKMYLLLLGTTALSLVSFFYPLIAKKLPMTTFINLTILMMIHRWLLLLYLNWYQLWCTWEFLCIGFHRRMALITRWYVIWNSTHTCTNLEHTRDYIDTRMIWPTHLLTCLVGRIE